MVRALAKRNASQENERCDDNTDDEDENDNESSNQKNRDDEIDSDKPVNDTRKCPTFSCCFGNKGGDVAYHLGTETDEDVDMLNNSKEIFDEDEDKKSSNHIEEDSDEDEDFKNYCKVLKSI